MFGCLRMLAVIIIFLLIVGSIGVMLFLNYDISFEFLENGPVTLPAE